MATAREEGTAGSCLEGDSVASGTERRALRRDICGSRMEQKKIDSLVLATTLLFPMIQLFVLLYLLMPGSRRQRPPGFVLLLRLMQAARPWGMIEVFMLGILVALIKLSNIAEVIPGPALWSFGGLTVLLTVVVSFNPRYLWHLWEQQQGSGEVRP